MSNLAEIKWLNINDVLLPEKLRGWMMHSHSFVERLKAQGVKQPEIEVLQQKWRLPTEDESNCLGLDSQSRILAREVLIVSAEKKWMYARTIFPEATLTGEQCQLANLKNQSLGSVLFKDPSLKRSEFTVACLTPAMCEYAAILSYAEMHAEKLWARRSLFTVNNKSLLLTEVFLPDIEML